MTNRTFLVGSNVEIIYACSLSPDGQLQLLNETKSGNGPSWLLPQDNLLYVGSKNDNKLETFTIDDRIQGKLTLKNRISSLGNTSCCLQIDPSGKWLVSANYGNKGSSNFVLFPLNNLGLPEEKGAQITAIDGSGPNPDRQDHSHCHHALFHKGYLYIVDLGTDTISVYRVNDANGEVSLVGDRIKTEPGAGPRHIIFHPNKPLAFVCNELNSTTNVYRTDASLGPLELLQTIKTRRPEDENDSNKENYTAELQFTPDGKNLLVSNRGDENIVIFNINEDTDEVLSVKQHLDSHGSYTWYFLFDPTGTFLLLANRKSNNLVCYSYNSDNDTYTYISQLENIESPQHIVFLS